MRIHAMEASHKIERDFVTENNLEWNISTGSLLLALLGSYT